MPSAWERSSARRETSSFTSHTPKFFTKEALAHLHSVVHQPRVGAGPQVAGVDEVALAHSIKLAVAFVDDSGGGLAHGADPPRMHPGPCRWGRR